MSEAQFSLKEEQLHALKDVAVIGSGHAALALSQLIEQRVNIAIVKVAVVPSDEFEQLIGTPETLGAVTYFQLLGELRGAILLYFDRADAIHFAEALLRKPQDSMPMLSEMAISALKEAGNILSGSYLNALCHFVEATTTPSIPRFVFDEVRFVVQGIVEEMFQEDKKGLALVTEFVESHSRIRGYFIYIPRREALEKILRGLKV